MPTRFNPFSLKNLRNYRLYLSGILVEVLAVLLLLGIGYLIAWVIPKLVH